MMSPSKKPKRTVLCDDSDEECPITYITPSKKQKCTSSVSFITSSPPASVKKDNKVEVDHSPIPTPSDSPLSTHLPTSKNESGQQEVPTTSTTFFSPSFVFLHKDSDSDSDSSSSEDGLTHNYERDTQVVTSCTEQQTVSIEVTVTSNACIQEDDNGTWYENGAVTAITQVTTVSSEEVEEEVEEEFTEFNPYLFIKNLPAHQPALRALLPPRLPTDPKLCLVLDLDETLVHCSTEVLLPADLVFPVVFNNVEYTVFARKRPYIEEFLSQMAALFEIVVFTASQEVYADRLLNILDPEKKYIRHRLFRDSCVCVEGNYLKDLTILGRDLSKVVIVDNSPQAFGYQVDNGIPIESWFDDQADQELRRLVPFLESMVGESDVRPIIRERFKLHELISKS